MIVNDSWDQWINALPIDWDDLIVLSGVAAIVTKTRRSLFAVGAVVLFTISFPPYSLPTWWLCLAPLTWIWRDQSVKLSRFRLILEAFAIGFAMCWLSTGFLSAALPAYGWLPHAVICFWYSFQVIIVAATIRSLRTYSVPYAALSCAVVAMVSEFLESHFGFTWSMMNMALSVGSTPLAQWSRWITPFGVSGGLHVVNFLLIPDTSEQPMRRWSGPLLAVTTLVLAWCGGAIIAKNVPTTSLPFSVLLVQPHIRHGDEESSRRWVTLDRLTRASLLSDGTVDLVVWPETCLTESRSHELRTNFRTSSTAMRMTVQDYAEKLTPIYSTNSLVGVVVSKACKTPRYGLAVDDVQHYNCGVLISAQGEVACHEKRILVPLTESLPWLLDFDTIRHRVLPFFRLTAPFKPGHEYRPLSFYDRTGVRRLVAVSICYESYFPWLPQYRDPERVDATIHLVNDGLFADNPGAIQRQILACQYRAIETRRWNLVCSTWSGSAVIDPSGTIVSKFPAAAGVLRSARSAKEGL